LGRSGNSAFGFSFLTTQIQIDRSLL